MLLHKSLPPKESGRHGLKALAAEQGFPARGLCTALEHLPTPAGNFPPAKDRRMAPLRL